jgi:hypothetical protein
MEVIAECKVTDTRFVQLRYALAAIVFIVVAMSRFPVQQLVLVGVHV